MVTPLHLRPSPVAPANTLPSNYHFKFIVEEISNVNDKAQVSEEEALLPNGKSMPALLFNAVASVTFLLS